MSKQELKRTMSKQELNMIFKNGTMCSYGLRIGAAVFGIMLVYGGPVQAAEGWYVSANAGVSMLGGIDVNFFVYW